MTSLPSTTPNVSTFVPLQKSTSRTRLNLLNPLNLLARRRSAQASERAAATSSPSSKSGATSGLHKASVGYEGIRGTKVHDFSAPRPRIQTAVSGPSRLEIPTNSPGKGEEGLSAVSAHTPVFKEDFGDGGRSGFPSGWSSVVPPVKRQEDWEDWKVPRPQYARDKELPAMPRSPEPETGSLEKVAPVPPPLFVGEVEARVDRPGLAERTLSYDKETKEEVNGIPMQSLEIGTKKTPLDGVKEGRTRNTSNASSRFSNMKHMKSNSSRFSFDMIGAATQEKLLEDRHREKEAENRTAGADENEGYDDEDENGFDYDDMMDDGLEERIPGVNADLEEEDEDDYGEEQVPGINTDLNEEDEGEDTYNDEHTWNEESQRKSLNGFTFHPMNTSMLDSPLSPQGPPQPTPRDSRGDVIGAALTLSPVPPMPSSLQQPETPEEGDKHYSEQVRISLEQALDDQDNTEVVQDSSITKTPPPIAQPEHGMSAQGKYTSPYDDMYFDDGTFGFDDDSEPMPSASGGGGAGGDFDESVFDNNDTDEYGRPIRNFDSSIPTTNYSPPGLVSDGLASDEASRRESAEDQLAKAEREMKSFAEGMSAFGLAGNLQPKGSVSHPLQPTMSLTQDTLNAHLQALAAHTQAALTSGRFRRTSDESPVGMHPYHFNSDNALADDFEDAVEDDFDYNDAFSEDDLIASANAEALAHDSGFYAQEFGFYSQPAPAAGDAAVYSHGGYFGPSGAGAISINRSKSGRVLEPNLTPITERSEYSNRNSIMSLPQLASQHGGSLVGSPGGLGPNLGLLQIAGMLREEDGEDMSIGALMRLRNKKWGGSQNSLSAGGQTPGDNRLSTGSPSMGMGHGQGGGSGGGDGVGGNGASSPQWTHTPWQQSQFLSSSPEMSKLDTQREAYGLGRHAHGHRRGNSAFSLHSEGEGVSPPGGAGSGAAAGAQGSSPLLTISPPPQETSETPVAGQTSSSTLQSENGFAHLPRPTVQAQGSSSWTVTLQSEKARQQTSPGSSSGDGGIEIDIPPPPPNLRYSLEMRPTSPTHHLTSAIGIKNGKGHRKTGSAESVSYVKEENPAHGGGERWVLERRRTAESGEWEVEREVVRGGRI